MEEDGRIQGERLRLTNAAAATLITCLTRALPLIKQHHFFRTDDSQTGTLSLTELRNAVMAAGKQSLCVKHNRQPELRIQLQFRGLLAVSEIRHQ